MANKEIHGYIFTVHILIHFISNCLGQIFPIQVQIMPEIVHMSVFISLCIRVLIYLCKKAAPVSTMLSSQL